MKNSVLMLVERLIIKLKVLLYHLMMKELKEDHFIQGIVV